MGTYEERVDRARRANELRRAPSASDASDASVAHAADAGSLVDPPAASASPRDEDGALEVAPGALEVAPGARTSRLRRLLNTRIVVRFGECADRPHAGE